jgi:hypothetical protein
LSFRLRKFRIKRRKQKAVAKKYSTKQKQLTIISFFQAKNQAPN